MPIDPNASTAIDSYVDTSRGPAAGPTFQLILSWSIILLAGVQHGRRPGVNQDPPPQVVLSPPMLITFATALEGVRAWPPCRCPTCVGLLARQAYRASVVGLLFLSLNKLWTLNSVAQHVPPKLELGPQPHEHPAEPWTNNTKGGNST